MGFRVRTSLLLWNIAYDAVLSDTDASGLGTGVLRWRHVAAGLGDGVGQDRPFGGAGGGLRDRHDQGIEAESVPWEIRGNVVLLQGRSLDAFSGLSPEVGGGWDQGQDPHEVFGPDPR